jgi:hypothetical protein
VLTAESNRIKFGLVVILVRFGKKMSQVEVSRQSPNVQTSSYLGAGYVPFKGFIFVTAFAGIS